MPSSMATTMAVPARDPLCIPGPRTWLHRPLREHAPFCTRVRCCSADIPTRERTTVPLLSSSSLATEVPCTFRLIALLIRCRRWTVNTDTGASNEGCRRICPGGPNSPVQAFLAHTTTAGIRFSSRKYTASPQAFQSRSGALRLASLLPCSSPISTSGRQIFWSG
jgi:hypothetical protein